MRYRFFFVPATMPEPAQEELNRFCAEHRVVNLDKHFVQDGERSYWAVCVCWLESQGGALPLRGKGKIDYREVLSEPHFAVFARLRSLRKRLSEKEGIPAYALFTNEQLAAMVQKQVRSKAALAAIDGVGTARVEKYGDAFLALLNEGPPEAQAGTEPSSK